MFFSSVVQLQYREQRYLFLIIVFLAGLLFSKAILSLSVGAIAINWIADRNILQKAKSIFSNKPLLAVLGILLIHLIGLIYTTDFQYALSDLRIKLPLLVFPVVFATEQPLKKQQIQLIVNAFAFFVIVSAGISTIIYLSNEFFTLRSISPFMSHIRFGILTTIASLYLLYHTFIEKGHTTAYKLYAFAGAAFLAAFTFIILGSVNGIVFFTIVFLYWSIVWFTRFRKRIISFILILTILLICMLPVIYIINIHNTFFPEVVQPENTLPPFTKKGNAYIHEHYVPVYENGIPVYGYYCGKELKEEWNKLSNITIEDSAINTFPVHDVLVRYLTSMNLAKDSAGISKLTDHDIYNIEHGITNYKLIGKPPIVYRLYELFQGYYSYIHFNNPNSNSLFMRFEYWTAAWQIIKKQPFTGVGTGDVNEAYQSQYNAMNSQLDQQWRLRAHNQYISITVALGIPGLLIFLFALIYPPLKKRKFHSFYFVTAYIVLMISMISEDTIESQIGVSIFSFFYSFFLFSEHTEENKIK